jgi:trans-aconitate methyltransferase
VTRNPWLEIPLADYEAHMALPTVGQSGLIADQLESLVRKHSPCSVGILGCAGGNGFDRLVGTCVSRVVGVDINPEYVEEARGRYQGCIPGLELYIADIQTSVSLFDPVDLLYAALVLEYVDVAPTLSVLRHHCKPGGTLAVLSQLPHETMTRVSNSSYISLQLLASKMRLVSPAELQRCAGQAGFSPQQSRTVVSPVGKRFSVDEFQVQCGARVAADRV